MDYSNFLLKGFVSPNDDGVIGLNDSESIQNAVEIARKSGIGKVVIPKYNKRANSFVWEISKTILLSSNLNIVLDDCLLKMADGVYENFFRTENVYTPNGAITDKELKHITIKGIGNAVLDGGRPNGLNEYNSLKNGMPYIGLNSPIVFFNVRYFSVENISILNQRWWGMRFEFCKFGKISDIFICAVRDRNNQDGIDIRNGCNNIVIENIIAQTGDDTIALSALDTMRDNKYNMVTDKQDNSIHSIIIRNIRGAALIHPLVALRNHNGIKLHDILIENIYDTEPLKAEEVTVHIQKGQTVKSTFIEDVGETEEVVQCDYSKYPRYAMIHIGDKAYYRNRHSVMGETYNITVNNVVSRFSERNVVLGCEIKDLRLTNISAAGDCRYAVSTCPENINGGPQVKLENVYIEGVNLKAETESETAALYFGDMPEGEYIKDMRVKNVRTQNATHLAVFSQNAEIAMEDIKNENLKGEMIKIKEDSREKVKVTIKE